MVLERAAGKYFRLVGHVVSHMFLVFLFLFWTKLQSGPHLLVAGFGVSIVRQPLPSENKPNGVSSCRGGEGKPGRVA